MARKKSKRKVGTRFTVKVKGGKKACMIQTAEGPRFTGGRSKTGSCKRPAAKKKTAAAKKKTAAKKTAAAKTTTAACATSQQIVRRGQTVTVSRTKKGKFCGGAAGSSPISMDRRGRYRRGGRVISAAAAEAEMNPASSFDRKAVPKGQPGEVFRASNGAYMIRLPGGGTRILSKAQGERLMMRSAPGGKVQRKRVMGKSSNAPIDTRKASKNPFTSIFSVPGVFKF